MLEPMLASLTDASLTDPELVYEPKYDGIRAIVEIGAGGTPVKLWSRLGNEKTSQFPEVVQALSAWAKRRKTPLVLDGEVVALDAEGNPAGFQNLQGRIHLAAPVRAAARGAAADRSNASTAIVVFDLLKDGTTDYRSRPLVARRAALEKLFARTSSPIVRISEQVRGDGREMYERAISRGWEGLIAKCADSLYQSGKRTPDWRKVKIVQEQEFVIGGWTEPRNTRSYFGALLLGVYENAASTPAGATARQTLVYVGHVGTGFDHKELGRLMKLMKPLETSACPFITKPPSNQRAHWIEPRLVAQVRFTEWTADGILRHPVYLGLRDDKAPGEVRREPVIARKIKPARSAPVRSSKPRAAGRQSTPNVPALPDASGLVEQLRAIENSGRDGLLEFPGGVQVKVTNLRKPFWPKEKLTKGDLFRYYAEVARFLLPVLADRPLVMKRFPNGIDAKPFYQHRAQDAPRGVRVESVTVAETRPHLIGGDLATLMYTTQLAAVSQDPWFSRVQSPDLIDHVALDLDPSDGVSFSTVLDVARWVHEELEALNAPAVAKTSGASGLHIYVPMPAGTPYEAGVLFAQIVATMVAQKHPRQATVERSVRARGKTVYVDYLQNVLGKTLASAYSARASAFAGVSTPLTWQEVADGVRPEDFTIRTVPPRLRQVGDLWRPVLTSKGADLSAIARLGKSRK
jgi:bifunctional non-homologous end joining protein LigD